MRKRRPVLAVLHPFVSRDMAFLRQKLENDYEFLEPMGFDTDSLVSIVRDAEVAIGLHLSSEVLSAAQLLRLFQLPSTGADGVALEELHAMGVAVANSHSHASLVAEHALGLALTLVKKLSLHDRLVRMGSHFRPASDNENEDYASDTLFGAHIGLVGLGAVGRTLVRLLNGFDVTLAAHVRNPSRHVDQRIPLISLEALLKDSDVLFLLLPLTVLTRSLIDSRALSLMKPNSYLINVSRPEIVDREALICALEGKYIRGAAIDGCYPEDQADSVGRLATLDNVILSPHRAGTHRDYAPYLDDVVENLLVYARTGEIRNRVCPDEGY